MDLGYDVIVTITGIVLVFLILVLLMFIGRVGPLTFGIALFLPSGSHRRGKEDLAI